MYIMEEQEQLRDAPPSPQPEQEPQPQPEPPKKKRCVWPWVLLIALAVLAALGWLAYRHLPVTVEQTKNGMIVMIGEAPGMLPAPPTDEPDAAAPQPRVGSGQTLNIAPSQEGAPNYAGQTENALSLQEIYRKVLPSVVTISEQLRTSVLLGTGIIMSSDGYIITNAHVVENTPYLSVGTERGETYTAALVGSDATSDLAVLKIEAEGLTAAEFGDSDALRVGDAVVAIGSPVSAGLRGTMTDGIISGISRDLLINGRKMNLLQTNAALNNGNSGGPLINCYGQIVGINAVKLSSSYTEGLGFAIPIATAKPIVDELIEKGYVSGRPALGISAEDLPDTVRIYYGLPRGAYVNYVSPQSDAAQKGISKGDIITALNGEEVTDASSLKTLKNQYAAGDTVTLTVYRGGQWWNVDVTLMERVVDR
ncbi:MAG: trypsin-like peptidase domain-containing protein [Oscillospiraceae bacterium]|nr:trypsin-like peptidase domain-containing protein [Oscillospiraceae bacterium]